MDTFIRQVGAHIVVVTALVNVLVVDVVVVFTAVYGFGLALVCTKFIRPVVEVTLQSLKLLSINSKPTQNSDDKNG